MKTFDMKRRVAVAMVACLPIACGSSLPTGSDVAALDAGATVSALRTVPPPPPPPGDDTNRACVAAAAEILIRRGSLPLPLYQESVLLQLLMLDKDGRPVSCQGIAWSFAGGAGFAADATITVAQDTRFATVAGLAGNYMVRATAPNGLSATVAIRLQ